MENPLRIWWKVRKWFRIPKPSIYFGPIISGLPCRLPNKWIELHSYDVTWKDKYDSPRFEFTPQINLELFKKYQLLLTFQIISLWKNYMKKSESKFLRRKKKLSS